MNNHPNRTLDVRRAQPGFSLVELMVAMALGLLLVVGVGTVYLGSRQTYIQQEALARMQEGARYAFELLTLDIRQAGYTGCAPIDDTFSTLNGTDWYNNLSALPLAGYESGAGLPTDVSGALANTDAVSVLRVDENSDYFVDSHNGPSAQFQLQANHDLKEGQILTVVPPDCSQAIVFQMTNVNDNDTIDVVVHNTGESSPGNSTKCLADPADPVCASESTFPNLPENSRIMRLIGNIYYLGTGESGQPALFRESLGVSGGNAQASASELVEGVEDMEILYGEDTTGDNNVDSYVAADAAVDWSNVLAVRVSLLMRSVENNVVSDSQQIEFAGETINAGVGADRRLRKVFTTTIAVRNRL